MYVAIKVSCSSEKDDQWYHSPKIEGGARDLGLIKASRGEGL